MKRAACLLLVLLCCLTSHAQVFAFTDWMSEDGESSFNARGAVTLSGLVSHGPKQAQLYPRQTEWLGASRMRLLADAETAGWFAFHANALAGFSNRTKSSMSSQGESVGRSYRSRYLGYDGLKDQDLQAVVLVDELSFHLFKDWFDLKLGRQPIGLATTYLYAPNDVFQPFSATAADTVFRPGVDALRITAAPDALSSVGLIAALGYDDEDQPVWRKSALLAHLRTNQAGVDFIALGGSVEKRYLVGWAVQGEIDGAGLRMEGNVSFPQDAPDQAYAQITAGADYRWPNSLHLIGEYNYRQNGTLSHEDYLRVDPQTTNNTDPYLGVHGLAASLAGDITPLLTMQGLVLANLIDGSFLLSPSFTYLAADEVELIAYAMLPLGRRPHENPDALGLPRLRSEYGSYPFTLSFQTRVYF